MSFPSHEGSVFNGDAAVNGFCTEFCTEFFSEYCRDPLLIDMRNPT